MQQKSVCRPSPSGIPDGLADTVTDAKCGIDLALYLYCGITRVVYRERALASRRSHLLQARRYWRHRIHLSLRMHGLQVLSSAADVYARSSIVSCRDKTMYEDMEIVAHFEQVLVHFE